ncbi:cell division cycle protein 20 homolog B [Boleophthalmus pectinirostris]|uniref:cell division cycle protein 20 homolog B n=1 Tax=Boleophthalmus pectinirostris TaxID=150288 RepID=UPI00243300B2|nr:cell division cycle protein 20 homolog B [Boleophthalmus pectinirostris]
MFRRRIILRNRTGAPAASTPLPTGWQQNNSFMLDTVRQRLLIDSPPKQHPDKGQIDAEAGATVTSHLKRSVITPHTTTPLHGPPHKDNAADPMMVWRRAGECNAEANSSGDLQPFSVLNIQSESQMSLAAPLLLDDYYTNLLDCSSNGVIALALGSSVYLWHSKNCALLGHLAPKASQGQASSHSQTILSLCWSKDGQELCIGNRRGDIELWDVEYGLSVKRVSSHQSAVRALSWKHNLVSSGSDLGQIHHYDTRGGAQVGTASQQGGVCSLQWSEHDQLASGSIEGQLHVWDQHISTKLREPVSTMRQLTSVKAMHWCPWEKNTIATGGGWKDGQVRIWDTKCGTCLTSVQTNSQICCLRWSGQKKRLVTGHGVPHHHISSWAWNSPDLTMTLQLSGHTKRVLHLAFNKDGSQTYTAGADQSVQIWDM